MELVTRSCVAYAIYSGEQDKHLLPFHTHTVTSV